MTGSACLGPADHTPSARKLAAFPVARDRHTGPALIGRSPFAMAEAQVAARLITEVAAAVICASDVTAIGVIRAAHRLGDRSQATSRSSAEPTPR